jgi:putative sterol carrier protein
MDTVEQFFAEVKGREHEPSLRRISGTVRYDLANGTSNGSAKGSGADHWMISIDKGKLTVAHRNGKADTVVRTDRKLFARIVTGRADAMASMLRGLVLIEGDPELAVLSGRLFATTGMMEARHA